MTLVPPPATLTTTLTCVQGSCVHLGQACQGHGDHQHTSAPVFFPHFHCVCVSLSMCANVCIWERVCVSMRGQSGTPVYKAPRPPQPIPQPRDPFMNEASACRKPRPFYYKMYSKKLA